MVRFGNLFLFNTKAMLILVLLTLVLISGVAAQRQLSSVSSSDIARPQPVKALKANLNNSSDANVNSPAAYEKPLNLSASQTDISVNGQSVEVPDNGTVTKVIESDGSQTTVNVQSQHSVQGQAGNTDTSSVTVNVNSSSSSSGDGL